MIVKMNIKLCGKPSREKGKHGQNKVSIYQNESTMELFRVILLTSTTNKKIGENRELSFL